MKQGDSQLWWILGTALIGIGSVIIAFGEKSW